MIRAMLFLSLTQQKLRNKHLDVVQFWSFVNAELLKWLRDCEYIIVHCISTFSVLHSFSFFLSLPSPSLSSFSSSSSSSSPLSLSTSPSLSPLSLPTHPSPSCSVPLTMTSLQSSSYWSMEQTSISKTTTFGPHFMWQLPVATRASWKHCLK